MARNAQHAPRYMRPTLKTWAGRLLHLAVAVIAALAALQAFPWPAAPAIPAAASPWTALCAALASRRATFLTLAALPLLLLALWRGRWFCRALCPTGWLQRLAEWRRPPRGPWMRYCPPLGKWIMLLGLGGALAGFPLFLAWDPLVLFTGFFSAWRPAAPYFHDWRPAAGLLALLLLAWLSPRLWCAWLCPLGAWMTFCGRAGSWLGARWKRWRHRPPPAVISAQGRHGAEELPARDASGRFGRRSFAWALGGLAAGGILRAWAGRPAAPPLRPPGAVGEDRFNGLCARCGNCLRACPANIIRPALGAAGLAGVLTPVLDFQGDYCHESCVACTQVCPTGAIRRTALASKPDLTIGTARVRRDWCIAWEHGEYCMVCDEFCPYKAVRAVQHGGVNCPEVDPNLCRGCGACQCQCPADPGPAIVVMRGEDTGVG